MPSGCNAQLGSVAMLVQVAAVPLVVARLVAAKATALPCQAEPFQYSPALGPLVLCRVNVTLPAFRPPPPVLSATLPLKFAGTVAARKIPPAAGAATAEVTGAVSSRVKLAAVPGKTLPTRSVAVAWMV